jgi:hypothetical protein
MPSISSRIKVLVVLFLPLSSLLSLSYFLWASYARPPPLKIFFRVDKKRGPVDPVEQQTMTSPIWTMLDRPESTFWTWSLSGLDTKLPIGTSLVVTGMPQYILCDLNIVQNEAGSINSYHGRTHGWAIENLWTFQLLTAWRLRFRRNAQGWLAAGVSRGFG